jgi:tetratricopeptide (TPR) repeat protein
VHRLRTGTLALVAMLFLGGVATGEEKLLSPDKAADVASALLQAGAGDMLATMAAKPDPDPWRVVEVLCSRGAFDVADAYAQAAPGRDAAALPRYVRHRRTHDAADAHEALRAARAALGRGEPEAAVDLLGRAGAGARDVPSVMAAYGRAELLGGLRRWPESAAAFADAAAAAEGLGWLRIAASARRNAGHGAFREGDLEGALKAWNEHLALEKRRDSKRGVSEAQNNIALVHKRRGSHRRAITLALQALEGMEKAEHWDGVAQLLGNIGLMHRALGEYPKALAYQERAAALLARLAEAQEGAARRRADVRTAMALANQGNLRADLGDVDGALARLRRAQDLLDTGDDPFARLRNRISIAAMLRWKGEDTEASRLLNAAMREAAQLNDRTQMLRVLQNLGDVQGDLGETRAALSSHEQALHIARKLNDAEEITRALVKVGVARAQMHKRADAVAALEEAGREAEALRSPRLQVDALTALAWIHRAEGRPDAALAAARRAAPLVEDLVRGQDDEGGARARGLYGDLYAVGTLSAAALDDTAEVFFFAETGRAGALLESLEGRDALRKTGLPTRLLDEELRARTQLDRRLAEYAALRRRPPADGRLAVLREARKAVDGARRVLRDVTARIQRHEKGLANVFYPRAATLREVRGALEPGDALVLYEVLPEESLALVVTAAGEHIVALGPTADIEARCGALGDPEPDRDPAAAIRALQEALIEPLGLGPETKRLLLSPSGAVSYVPFALLVDVAVTYVPSATAWLWLREDERPPGEGVLALGHPDYRGDIDAPALALYWHGRGLAALPETKEEVEGVGDRVLIGRGATRQALSSALAEKRWRAVHLACHGLIDPARPTLTNLALTPTADDAGIVTVLDLFRMKVPADLAVLSACQTARGTLFRSEGIVGLTRAFMYAGTPRVICSLWKVPDDATRALMEEFYRLWNAREDEKKTSAAEALRRAQKSVAEQPRWRHPYYWGAWVLWGLSD